MKNTLHKKFKKVIACILVLSIVFASKGFLIFTDNFRVYANENETDDRIVSPSSIKKELILDGQNAESPLFGWTGGSSTSGDNRIVSSEFEYASITFSSKEDKSRFYYTDDYFKNDSTIYNNHLSTMSIELAASGIGNYIEDDKDKYANLKDVFSKIGFINITPNADFLRHPEENTMGSVCANKHIYLKDTSGNVQDYNLFAVAMRSANYSNEWLSNLTLGDTGDHHGFVESRDKIYDHFNTFYNEHKDDFGNIPIKIWVVGYSRGAAVANMLAGKLTDECTSFNTTKENIYCYTLGTPRGALISNHTAVPLESYTNIHNVVTDADFIQFLAPPVFGFGRYGVDHKIPTFVSDKVHNTAERAAKQAQNTEYMIKYNKMLSRLRQIDPKMYSEINDLQMYKFTIFDINTFQYLIFERLGDTPFVETSDEKNYYQAKEYLSALINGILKYALECNFAGTDYGTITGRDRFYQKYQELVLRLFKIFYLDANAKVAIEKIKQNATDNILSIAIVAPILYDLVYCDGMPPDRTDVHSMYLGDYNVYDKMQPIYEILLNGALSTEDHGFLMSRHRDVTDFLLDLLNADFRATDLPEKSTLGTFIKNLDLLVVEHKISLYLSWLQAEDEYFDTAPSNTLKYDGIKALTFTNLSDSKIECYNENNNKICEYTIDASNTVTCVDYIDTEYVHIAKSYNPEGLELRLASDKNYKAIVTTNDKSLGQVIYREYFLDDAEFYRKEIDLGEIYLKNYENLEVEFNSSSLTKVYSCYKSEDLNGYRADTFEKVENHGVDLSYGYDYFTHSNMPNIYKTIKISGESIKDATAGNYANFAGTSFESQDSNVENIDIDSDSVYKKIDLLSNKNAVVHIVNNVNDGYSGERTYNNYDNTVKTETNMNYNKTNIYYVGKDTKYSVLHSLEVNEGSLAGGLLGALAIDDDIATKSDANEKELNENSISSSQEEVVSDEIENTTINNDFDKAINESVNDTENESTINMVNIIEEANTEANEIEEITSTSEETIIETEENGEESTEPTEFEETTTIENTVGGFTNTEDVIIIATESELELNESATSDTNLYGVPDRIYYVSVPSGYATDISGNEKKYFNNGDAVKIYITKEDTGKKISSISIFNGDTLVETIENVVLNQAIDYTVSDFDIRVVANYENKKYVVNFTTQAEGTFYYFNGQSFVEGISGNEYEYGTKIRFTAPMTYDGREFYGWTLKDSSGRYLNQKDVDTPKIIDESSGTQSTYTLELKDYSIDILANYRYKAYSLTLQIDSSKGVATPSGVSLIYTNVDDFNAAKGDIGVESIGPKAFIYWSDGLGNYLQLADYSWQYKRDVILTAVFEGDTPSGGGGDSGDSGGSGGSGGGGGGAGPIPSTTIPQVTEINNVSGGASIAVDVTQSTWIYDPISNKFKLDIEINGQKFHAVNGFYTINTVEKMIINRETKEIVISNTYCFDPNGNMVTGWVNTIDSKWYFFETAKTKEEGKMVTGWKEVQGSWYFFASNGVLLINTITPDGYLVGADGKWIAM